MPREIRFYDKKDPYYEFSNFYDKAPFELDGVIWSTTEHYFQAQKFDNKEYRELIRKANTPNKAFILAQQKKKGGYAAAWTLNKEDPRTLNELIDKYKHLTIDKNWDTRRLVVMEKALMAKFSQPKLKELLLNTKDAVIIEDSPRDSYWGIGKDGKGENQLGKLLMKVRANLVAK